MSNHIENSENVLSGNQFRDIGGNLYVGNVTHNYGKKQIEKYLTIPPFQSDFFIGREQDLTAIHEKLFQGDNLLLLVNGRGGMGKTTIAAKYFKKYEAEYQHLAWVFTGESLLDALLTLAIPLQVQFGEKMPNEERLPLVLQAMSNLKKPCLLVIDNANSPAELQKYYLALRTCPNFHLLLTTRITSFENAVRHEVKPLKKADRFDLFQKHYPKLKNEEHELLSSIMTAVGNNTLVIELLAKNLRQFNRLKTNYSLAQLWEDLQQKGLLAIQGKAVTTAYQAGDQLREATPETIIAAMYDLNDISPAERQLLSVFAVLPAENIPFGILGDLLANLDDLENNLLALADIGWLEFDEAYSTFKVSPVVQEIVMQKNEDLLGDTKVLFDRLNELLLFDANTGNLENISFKAAILLVYYAENIINSIPAKDDNISMLCERVGKYFETTGDLMNALTYFEHSAELDAISLESDPSNPTFKNYLAISLSRLGSTHSYLGNLEKALEYFEKYTRLEKELYDRYPENVSFKNGLAISYEKLGSTHSSLGNLEKALEYFEEYARLKKELYDRYPENVSFKNGLAISYYKLAHIHKDLNIKDKYKTYLQQAEQLFVELVELAPQYAAFQHGLNVVRANLEEI